MQTPRRIVRRQENVPGALYVDTTCIDCDVCRFMSPKVFQHVSGQSAVTHQPATDIELHTALQALLSCPTHSIHADSLPHGQLAAARDSFPIPLQDDIYFCGFNSEKSYGASSYFIQRKDHGNILVDVPRWQPSLAEKLESMGGVEYIFLTHRDDVGDHAHWAKRFNAKRIIHEAEVNVQQGTTDCEIKVTEETMASVFDGDDTTTILYTPGHTRGCISLFYNPSAALFTGDHLGWSAGLNKLTIFKRYNWWSVEKQVESVAKLIPIPFLHVYPGHGRRCTFGSDEEKRLALQNLITEEKG